MPAARVSRASRRFSALGLLSLVCWQAFVVAGAGRRVAVALGVVGFVLSVAFGKAYALVPTYFDRTLAFDAAPGVHLVLAALGIAGLAGGTLADVEALTAAGALLWVAGVGVFLGTFAWTVRGNLSGHETATGEHNARLRATDRAANAAVPVVALYLLAGAYELLARLLPVPTLTDRGLVAVAHFLAPGVGVLLLLAVGTRLLPRFTVTTPSRPLVAVALPAGALGPAVLVAGYPAGPLFTLGAVLEATAVVGFAALWARMRRATDRDRVGFAGVSAAAGSGVVGVALGLGFATGVVAPTGEAVLAHLRLNVLGLLGLAIVGVLFQFYPPAAGAFEWNDDRTALVALGLLAGGLWVEAAGHLLGTGVVATAGAVLGLAGSLLTAGLVAGVFRMQTSR